MKIDHKVIGLHGTGKTLEEIAILYGVTRQYIKKYLNLHGVNTSRRIKSVLIVCDMCGVEFIRFPKRVDMYGFMYCSIECYHKSIKNENYQQNRNGQRIARKVIGEVFKLEGTHVVHHIDGNCKNNKLYNLLVFCNQSEHLRWHRLKDRSNVVPIFRGS